MGAHNVSVRVQPNISAIDPPQYCFAAVTGGR
jgi:hypothetical protein